MQAEALGWVDVVSLCRINSTKCPALDEGKVTEACLISQAGSVREFLCAWISLCSRIGGGAGNGLLT